MRADDEQRRAAVDFLRAHPEQAGAVLAEAGIASSPPGGRFAWETAEDGSVTVRLRDEHDAEAETAG